MIHSLSANQSSFHSVNFTAGLNVVLGERSIDSTGKDTRNGIGKSTLIDIINFCLGGRATKGKGLIIDELKDWAFTLEITIKGNRVRVTRSISEHGLIIVEGSAQGWPYKPEKCNQTSRQFFKIDRWRKLLGQTFFGIPRSDAESDYSPSFRSLVSYFVRRGPDAYTSPFRHFSHQKTWDSQLHIAYLLGLNWEYASRWQTLKDKEVGVKALEKAIKSGALEGAIGTAGELETHRIQLERELYEVEQAVEDFNVHPQYESIQEEANQLTAEMHELANKNIEDKRRLTRYEESIRQENPPDALSLESLYKESGLVFPAAVIKTLHEAREFHEKIVSNRRDFLKSELRRIRADLDDRDARIKELSGERSELLKILRSHGALQELAVLQQKSADLSGTLNRVKNHLREIKNLKATKREVKTSKEHLLQIAEQDHEERRELWSEAVRLFNENSQALYKTPGNLVIDLDETGYRYSVDIERSGSEGIEKMKVFCFDLAMLELQMKRGKEVDFLIHDTLMFDSVDARQRALALEHAQKITNKLGGQYICTMNSDMVPRGEFSDGFYFDDFVKLIISDSSPSESLLGIRFEKQ
jgi:uncharacterized protein YydD (DUF2326 family)